MKTDLKILAFVAFASCVLVGCASIALEPNYNGDKFLDQSDQSVVTAHKILHEFVSFERNNPWVAEKSPQAHEVAQNIRHNEKKWKHSYDALRSAYIANKTDQTKNDLDVAVGVFTAAAAESTQYLK